MMMNTKRMRLVAGVLTAMVLSASTAAAIGQNLIFNNLRGTVHLIQNAPCGTIIDATTTIADGRIEMSLSQEQRRESLGAALFDLSRLDLFLTPFAVQHQCAGVSFTAEFREVGIRLARAVTFTGEPVGSIEERKYRFSIPKEQVLLYESVLNNLPVQQPETAYQHPSEDVTGEIDLRRGTAQVHVALTATLRIKAGCEKGRCQVDGAFTGRQLADVSGVLISPFTDTDGDRVPDLSDSCPLVASRAGASPEPVVIRPPDDVTVRSCGAAEIGIARAVDVCHARPVSITSDAPAKFAAGRTVVTWSASNGIDPAVSAQQIVTVESCDELKDGDKYRRVKEEKPAKEKDNNRKK